MIGFDKRTPTTDFFFILVHIQTLPGYANNFWEEYTFKTNATTLNYLFTVKRLCM